jgi:hypothetical protein
MPFNGTTRATIQSVALGLGIWDEIRSVYQRAKSAQARLNLYQAGTDPKFNATVNNIFTAGERAELAQMLTQINNLVNDWELNHVDVIGPLTTI